LASESGSQCPVTGQDGMVGESLLVELLSQEKKKKKKKKKKKM
jgi:hypothetical protein